ncbi:MULTISPECIES: hypothetical protein [Streptomyces]|uniref:hypothetical protein n=1 Tax=Streptomyces TaxID=1883 RepID=UPI0002D8421E|nr:hypothetical protein [Streptomyces scabiei]MDX3175735.1 hypothetical protein [Streptomyces scabiei]
MQVSYGGGRIRKAVAVHGMASGKPYLSLTNPEQPGTVSLRAAPDGGGPAATA